MKWTQARSLLGVKLLTAGLALGAVASLVLEYGFVLNEAALRWLDIGDVVIASGFALLWCIRLVLAPSKPAQLRKAWLETGLIALLLFQAAVLVIGGPVRHFAEQLRIPNFTKWYLVVLQVYLVVLAIVQASEAIASRGVRPPIIILVSFVLIIAIGSGLLMLPRAAARPEAPIRPLDAIFTATSAACVTGLAIRDTGSDFSEMGQWIILGLIQVGGFGLVTFAAFFLVLSRKGLGVRHSLMLGEASSYNLVGEVGRFLGWMVLLTVSIELVGAAVLFGGWHEPGMSTYERARWSLFHSVSAFCNAGFGLRSDNFVSYAGDVRMSLTICGLVILGGLGYAVLLSLLQFRVGSLPIFRRWTWTRRRLYQGEISRLPVHTKIVLWMTGLLLVLGTAAFWALEANGTLEGRPVGEQLLISFFHSTVSRTAGFNSVDIGALRLPTITILIALMAVGASPGSTGGGIKTVGIAVLFAMLVAMLRNRENVELHRRTLPRTIVNQAVTVSVLYALAAFVFSTALSITDPGVPYYKTLFETVSALSTVGVSTGITPTLSVAGKLLLCLVMVLGRVGPLVVLMSIAGRVQPLGYEYPKEEVAVA